MSGYLFMMLLAVTASASPMEGRAAAPTVSIRNGSVVGSTSWDGVDTFLGIPYAQPPTLTKRLRPPQALTATFSGGTVIATAKPKACPQFSSQVDTSSWTQNITDFFRQIPIFNASSDEDEDCLTINIQRPAGTSASSNYPVVFWIFGGGFMLGSTAQYDASTLIKRSINLKAPIIYVSVNYRLGGWGFLAGKELAKAGSTNLGLRDQRLGLQWVQENIATFGGNPANVTIWGESAGAHSAYDHTVINGGDHTYKGKPLFKGAIMNSGGILPADTVTSLKAQAIYDTVVKNAGCASASDTLDCLRKLDYYKFHDAANSVPAITGYRSLDISYLPRPDPSNSFFAESPENALKTGKYAKIPVINGNQQDEGTIGALVQSNITNGAQVIDYFTAAFPGNANARRDVTAYLSLYNDSPGNGLWGQPDGSPFNTTGNNIYPEFKRIAAVIGDQFILLRRVYQNAVYASINTWAYQSSFWHGNAFLGTFHGTDVLFSYGMLGDWQPLTNTLQTYWISFANYGDPNAIGNKDKNIFWPKWDAASRQLLDLPSGDYSRLIKDNFREAAYQYQIANVSQFRL